MEPIKPGGDPKSKWKLYAIAGVIGVIVILFMRSKSGSSSGGSASANPTGTTGTTAPNADAQQQFQAIDSGISSLQNSLASTHAGATQPASTSTGTPAPVGVVAPSQNTDFISTLYQQYLGRSPDQGGATFWQGDLAKNVGALGPVAGKTLTEQQFAGATATEQASRKTVG